MTPEELDRLIERHRARREDTHVTRDDLEASYPPQNDTEDEKVGVIGEIGGDEEGVTE